MKLAIFFFVVLISFASAQIFQQQYRRPTPRPVYTYNVNPGRYSNDGRYSGGDDGQYHPDDSGAYHPDGSGGYQHQDGGYKHQDAGYRHQGDRFGGDGSGGRYQGGSGSYTGGSSSGVAGVAVGAGSGVAGGISGAGGSGSANRFQGQSAGLKQGNAAGLYDNRNYAIIRKVEHVEEDGYHYLYETENGILGEEEGHLQNKGAENEAMRAKGFFTYTGPDSVVYTVEYTADDNGFVPAGAHLPTPPPVPIAIIRSLEYQRSIGELKD